MVTLGHRDGGPSGVDSTPPATAVPSTASAQTHPEPHRHDDDVPHGDDEVTTTAAPVPLAVEQLVRSPLARALPHSTAHYRVDGRVGPDGLVLTITLHAVLNHARQAEEYTEELRQYKEEALSFVASHGVDPSRLPVVYVPPEAAHL